MTKTTLTLCAMGALTVGAYGQTLLAKSSFDWHDKLTGGDYQPGATFKVDHVINDCIEVESFTTVGWSNRKYGNGSYQYHCFGVFGGDINPHDYVGWKVTYANDAVGGLSVFEFDIKQYDGDLGTDAFKLAWFSNGVEVGSTTGAISTSWQTYSVNVSGLDSAAGSSDMFEFRLTGYDANGDRRGKIGLDNYRIFGDLSKVPEPSTALLGAFGALGLAFRRRRA